MESQTKSNLLGTAKGKNTSLICSLLAPETLLYQPSLKGEKTSSDSSCLIPFCFGSGMCEAWSGTLMAGMADTVAVAAGCGSVGTGFGVDLVFEVTGFELLLLPKLLTYRQTKARSYL